MKEQGGITCRLVTTANPDRLRAIVLQRNGTIGVDSFTLGPFQFRANLATNWVAVLGEGANLANLADLAAVLRDAAIPSWNSHGEHGFELVIPIRSVAAASALFSEVKAPVGDTIEVELKGLHWLKVQLNVRELELRVRCARTVAKDREWGMDGNLILSDLATLAAQLEPAFDPRPRLEASVQRTVALLPPPAGSSSRGYGILRRMVSSIW